MELFRKKLAEDGGDIDLKKYLVNMGRTDTEIKDMRSRVKEELFDRVEPIMTGGGSDSAGITSEASTAGTALLTATITGRRV